MGDPSADPQLPADHAEHLYLGEDEHPRIVIIADMTRTGGEAKRAVRRLERLVSERSDYVAYLSDWL